MYLLDTNVVSELRKVRAGRAAPGVARWADSVDASDLYISVVTLEELEIGVLLVERKNARQGAVLRAWLNQQVQPAFADCYIAATALEHRLTVVTRNVTDFSAIGVQILNPWGD